MPKLTLTEDEQALLVIHVHGFFPPYAVLRQMYTAK